MRIGKVHVKNFRSFANAEVNLDPYCALVGPNGAGKSTILSALNLFFKETENVGTNLATLDAEDFHDRNTKEPVEITVTFVDLGEEAQKDFAAYFRNGSLIVTARAVFDTATNSAPVRQFGQRMGMAEFKEFFKAYNDGEKAGPLKDQYEALRAKFNDLPKAGSKDANYEALRTFEDAHPERCISIPSEDQFYGWSKGSNLLQKHLQWVYVPAVKDATDENIEASNTALGKLLARTVRSKVNFQEEIQALRTLALERYKKIIDGQQGALNAISKALQDRLVQWAHPEATARLAWQEDGKKSVRVEEPVARLIAGEGTFEGELARFGHGLQRCYLLALLQELVSYDLPDAPKLILGCEEPELYQHPPQARHLSSVLECLSDGNAQIVVTTHSPYFVSGKGFETVRMVARIEGKKYSGVSQSTFDIIAKRYADATGDKLNQETAQQAKLQQALNPSQNEMFFTRRLILVEGLEDIAYLTTWLILTGRWDEFRARGCHAVPVGGKDKLILPLIVAQELGIPCFVILDSDGHVQNVNSRKRHERDNKAILKLSGQKSDDAFPTSTFWAKGLAMWSNDIGHTLKAEAGNDVWDKAYGKVRKEFGDPDGDFTKNATVIGSLLTLLHGEKVKLASLDRACAEVLAF